MEQSRVLDPVATELVKMASQERLAALQRVDQQMQVRMQVIASAAGIPTDVPFTLRDGAEAGSIEIVWQTPDAGEAERQLSLVPDAPAIEAEDGN